MATSNLPQPLSNEQILSNQLAAYASKVGLNDFQVGSLVTSFFEVTSLVAARTSGDIFSILTALSIDRASGDILQRLALDANVIPVAAAPSTGVVTVIDTNFVKISTQVYAGALSPNIGSTTILVSNATAFPSTGAIYIGRGTPNVEGPLPYSGIAPVGSYYSITLTTPTTKYHNVGESVILSQGGVRTVPVNTVAFVPASGAAPEIDFSTTVPAIILDGETSVSNVPVTAQLPGSSGNVPGGSITQFTTAPFSGATVTNPLPFTNGRDTQTDEQLRVSIKIAKSSIGLATAYVVENSVLNATSTAEPGTIISSDIVNNTNFAVLYIDNGTGYEEKSVGVGIETIVDSALGGEKFFQLATGGAQTQVAKAFLISSLAAPFDIVGGDTLAVTVGEVTYSHTFANSDFRSPGGATAYEMCTSINADTTLGFQATTSGGGMFLVISAISEINDSVKTAVPVTEGRDVSVQVGFSSSTIETLRLYKNNVPLSKDGNAALIFAAFQTAWSPSIANGETLIIAVDGTAPITFTITNADFVETGLYTSVSPSNSLESWVEVFNNKLTGLTASLEGTQIQLESNLGNNNRASIVIDPSSTLVAKGMFTSALGLSATGAAADYFFFRGTAQFQLIEPLKEFDKLSAGTAQTEAIVESSTISGGGVTLATTGHVWVLIDQPGTVINTGVVQNSPITVSKPSTNVVRYTSGVTSAFSNVLPGDYVIIWSLELPSTDRFEGRVYATTATTLDLLVTSAEWSAATPIVNAVYKQGFVVVRTNYIPQKFQIPSGTATLEQIAASINLQTNEMVASIAQDENLVFTSNTKDTTGYLLIVTSDTNGKLLLLADKLSNKSVDSLIAYRDSGTEESQFPLFLHSTVSSEEVADPINSYITTFNSTQSLAGQDPNDMVGFLEPYGQVDGQAFNEYVQMASLPSSNTVDIKDENNLRRLRLVDRFFLASPLDFGPQDTAVVIADNNPVSESFVIPFFRLATTNTTFSNNTTSFNAYDTASGASAQFASFFGDFDFSNFKVNMQAKKVLKPTPSQTAILYRSTQFGSSGENINVSYAYPSAANQGITSTVTVGTSVNVVIFLKSGNPVASSIDSTTEWNVTITPNTPVAGIDQVTYTYSGIGTAPALSLVGGEYVNIGSKTELNLANTGTFRLSTQGGFGPTSTAFTVQRPTGVAVPQSNASTLVNGQILFYQNDPTSAAEVATYVNSNLANYVSATLVNDGGSSGSGIIVLSTYEDSGFTVQFVTLKDGINWIASSNLLGNPQFTLKNPLTLDADVGYTFNNGEMLYLTPTTMDQVKRFLNILAVTGFTTVGTVNVVDRGTRVELATDTLGSTGAIQVVGGNANTYSVPVTGAASLLANTYTQVPVSSIAGAAIQSDQWFELTATQKQKKQTSFQANTSITVTGENPTSTESLITLSGGNITQRYFGIPRSFVRVQGRTFKIENQGSMVCLSWNGQGMSPNFQKSPLNFNDAGGGTFNAFPVAGTSDIQFIIESGNANFTELSIGDLVTISGLATKNNGTFLVTGVSADGKTIQVANSNGVAQLSSGTFTFSANSTSGDTFNVNGISFVAGTNFAVGITQADTIANFTAIAGTAPGVTASFSGNVVTITATTPSASVPISYSGTPVVTVSGAFLTGPTFVAGNFSATGQVSEGDNVIINGAFNILNQGKFRIIRRYNDSVWFNNPDAVPEEVTLPSNLINLNVDATSSLNVNATGNNIFLSWNGIGTEPTFGLAKLGDIVTLGTDFSAPNRGSFMVISSSPKLQEITQFLMPAGSQFATFGVSDYFLVNSAGNVNQYYVWFNVNGATTDPAPVGPTSVMVNILNGDNAVTVAAKTAAALTTQVGLTAISSGVNLIVTTTGSIITTTASNVTMPSPFSITLLQAGTRTFLEAINPSAVNESTVFVTGGVFQDYRPQMVFSEYDATVAGDSFVVTGNILGSSNTGSYSVVQTVDRNNIIVNGAMTSILNVSLNSQVTAVYILEEKEYVGYKHVYSVAAEPGTLTTDLITFDTSAQYDKINISGGVELTSQNKMNWPTNLRLGLDSYRFDIGLIQTANQIIYGDPADNITYPGKAAAGAEIVIRGPLVNRIIMSIVIRTVTGVAFAQVQQQVQNAVAALINGSPIGQSIPISSIIDVVSTVYGVFAVSISSPNYSPSNDLIAVVAGQKAYVINPNTDISVSLLGS